MKEGYTIRDQVRKYGQLKVTDFAQRGSLEVQRARQKEADRQRLNEAIKLEQFK